MKLGDGREKMSEAWAVATAVGGCALMAGSYVGFLYILVPAEVRKLPREHDRHIRARFVTVAASCVLSLAVVAYCKLCTESLWTLVGIRLEGLVPAFVIPMTLVATLYLGNILILVLMAIQFTTHDVDYSGKTQMRKSPRPLGEAIWLVLLGKYGNMSPLMATRNLVVGPVSEELVFRGCMLPLLLCAGVRPWKVIVYGPLFFGTAHLHHFLTRRLTAGWKHAALETAVQMVYTYLFGLFAGFVFVRMGNLWAPTLPHVFCNFMGLPDFAYLAEVGDQMSVLYPRRHLITAAYFLGIGLFAFSLAPLTASPELAI